MAKEVTLTLDTDSLRDLRELVGARNVSAAVDAAVRAHVARLRHVGVVDEWLAELERAYAPIPTETEWAAQIVDRLGIRRNPSGSPGPA